MSVVPDSHADLLEALTIAHVATTGPGGEPQVNPAWFEWDGSHLCFSQTTRHQKYRNLHHDPRIGRRTPWHQPGEQRVVVKVLPVHCTHMG